MSETARTAEVPMDPDQRRRVRRSALLLGAFAIALYVGYIVYTIVRAAH
jgi:hypothetical protein